MPFLQGECAVCSACLHELLPPDMPLPGAYARFGPPHRLTAGGYSPVLHSAAGRIYFRLRNQAPASRAGTRTAARCGVGRRIDGRWRQTLIRSAYGFS